VSALQQQKRIWESHSRKAIYKRNSELNIINLAQQAIIEMIKK
jgi:hypothetical protein